MPLQIMGLSMKNRVGVILGALGGAMMAAGGFMLYLKEQKTNEPIIFVSTLNSPAAEEDATQPKVFSSPNEQFPQSRDNQEMLPPLCKLTNKTWPADLAIYGAGAYGGRKTQLQIDQSGHESTEIDVVVNEPHKPVALILGAYEPTVWNISHTPKTKIVAVVVGGYHRQALLGLDKSVTALASTFDNKGPCGYFYFDKNHIDQLNPLARQLFNKPADTFYPLTDGKVVIGDTNYDPSQLSVVRGSPELLRDPNTRLAGAAGLQEAVQKGDLRLATDEDIKLWQDEYLKKVPAAADVPVIAGQTTSKPHVPEFIGLSQTYVVLKEGFTYPAGLYGGNSVTFIIPKGVPLPNGNPGHSPVYNTNTGGCIGPVCRME
jgi:hypothetical protein